MTDLVDGVLRMMASDKTNGETVNLGNADEYTVLETAQVVKEVVSGQFDENEDLVYQELPKDDPTRRRPDISKAKELLDWEPKIGFEVGLKRTVEYFKRLKQGK